MAKKNEIKLTEGNIFKLLIQFSWPVLISHFFQLLYNQTNELIVGNFVGKTALSAVSACSSILNIFTYFFGGFAIATTIIIGKRYGSEDKKQLSSAVETLLIFALIVGIGISLVAEILAPTLLTICNVKDELMELSVGYFRVFMLGGTFQLAYDLIYASLRTMGYTKNSLSYLVISSIVNLIIGVILVRVFDLSVYGTAIATIIAKIVTVVLSLRFLFKLNKFEINLKHPRFDFEVAKELFKLGVPASIQNMLIGLSTSFIQSYINLFPNEAISGIGVTNTLVNIVQFPMQSVASFSQAFVAQNRGAEKYDRIKECSKIAIRVGVISTIITATIVCVFAEFFVSLFNKDPEIIRYGSENLRYLAFAFIPLTFSHIYNGECRASGNVILPLFMAVASQVIFRCLFCYVAFQYVFDVRIIYLSGALCYCLAGLLATLYFHFSKFTKDNHLR